APWAGSPLARGRAVDKPPPTPAKTGVPHAGKSMRQTMPTLHLPLEGGRLEPYTMRPARRFPAAKPPFNRIAYAAAHVVADPTADGDPCLDAAPDWGRTVPFPRHLWAP